ncbi:MAG: translation initiation factor IF-3 [Verrucomicrobiae bacterium]|nr:translation initiation factor IF-3 [Verrucomicrobiae bacterium]
MAKKPFKRRPRREVIRINERIRVPEVRVLYKDANKIMPTRKAVELAKNAGLDLVEVASNARPPVCRIVDYGKWRYEQSKQKKDKQASKPKEKEIKFRVRIEQHDYEMKMKRAEDFLAHGYKLRMQLQFRGRENAHKELGFELMQKVKRDLEGMAHVDLEPKLNNRSILMLLSPLAKEKQRPRFRMEDDEEEVDFDAHDAAEAADEAAHHAEVPDDEHHDEEPDEDEEKD